MQQRPFASPLKFAPICFAAALAASAATSAAERSVKLKLSDSSQDYRFDTGRIFGCIEPYKWYHGVARFAHRDEDLNIVKVNPTKAFLNAEYYMCTTICRSMLPRQISKANKTTHGLAGDSVVIHFPPEPKYRFAMDLTYRPHGDAVDMRMKIMPSKDVAKFEIFFASYVLEALKETWVPLKQKDESEQWTKLKNREVINNVFGIVRDNAEREKLDDGRYGNAQYTKERHWRIEAQPFSKPILVARNPNTGFALVFLLDPNRTTYLCGQYHGDDTAHDWCFGDDLISGKPMTASARMIYRRFANQESMFRGIAEEWSSFAGEH